MMQTNTKEEMAKEAVDLGTDAARPVRKSARPGTSSSTTRAVRPVIPHGDIWLDVDVAAYLHVCPNTVKRIANKGPRTGEVDLRLARPVFIGDRRWVAENVKELVRNWGKQKA